MSVNDLRRYIPRDKADKMLAGRGPVTALLDAACLPGLPEWIESRGAESMCLFQGDAARDMRDIAPYLIRSEKLLHVFTDERNTPWAMWHKRPGILILSDLDLAALRKHFRRFLRPQREGRSYFFRFWEPASAIGYFDSLDRNEPDRQRWFHPREGGRIEAFLVPDPDAGGLQVFESGPPISNTDPVMRPFALKDAEYAALQAGRIRHDLEAITALIMRTFPQRASQIDPADLDKAVRRTISRMAELGIRQRGNAFRIAAWDLHSDGPFERRDPDRRLRQILETNMPEADKMRRLTERLGELNVAQADLRS